MSDFTTIALGAEEPVLTTGQNGEEEVYSTTAEGEEGEPPLPTSFLRSEEEVHTTTAEGEEGPAPTIVRGEDGGVSASRAGSAFGGF